MKNFCIQLIFAGLLLTAFGCTKNFEAMNTNPNSPVLVPATNVFGSGIINSANVLFGTRLNVYYTGSFAGQLQNIGAGDYEYRVDINNSMWVSVYTAMRYFVDAMDLAENEENANLKAAALTMKAYVAQKTTDMWGDIPYSEAFKAEEGVSYPVYDKQKDVYTAILSELKTASEMFAASAGDIGAGDLIFKGDIDKWKTFCNSLRLRVAIRLANVEPQTSAAVISEVLGNSAYPIMTENSENAYLYYPGVAPDQEIWFKEMGSAGAKTTGYRINQVLVDALKDNEDPRLPVYADPNRWGEYNGYRFYYGQTRDTMNNGNNVSHVGDRFSNDPKGFSPFMNCAEVYFILAEAYERGFVSGDAEAAYVQGITRSLEENGITGPAVSTFLSRPGIAWGTGTLSNLEKINLQKWISLFKQSIEAWSEARRTDVPLMTGVSEDYALMHTRPPFRMPYADEEKTLNQENFPTYVQVKDIFYGDQVWWDTRTGVH